MGANTSKVVIDCGHHLQQPWRRDHGPKDREAVALQLYVEQFAMVTPFLRADLHYLRT